MSSILKVDTIQDQNGNLIISKDSGGGGFEGTYFSSSSPKVFTVKVITKTAASPYHNVGSNNGYSINAIETPIIELKGNDTEQEFLGYKMLTTPVRIVRYRKITNSFGDLYQLIFNMTPFYPEGGGQVGDKGYLEAPNGNVTYIYDTKRENNIIVHTANQLPADLGATYTAVVDKQDCDVLKKKDNSIGLGWKFGGLMWGFGPEIKIGHSSGVEWKSDVQRMVAEYQELCTQFNTGRLSQQEYQQEKEGIIKRGYNYAQELEKRFKQKKDDMFKEMDEGKYIHLQNARFYEGCCYYPNKKEEQYLVGRHHFLFH